jgi:hypothetical protein
VIIAEGGESAGFSFFIKDGHLVYENNFFGKERDVITSNDPLPKGKVTVAFEYTQEDKTWGGGGTGHLYINDKEAGEAKFEHVVPACYSATESFDIGMDLGSAVSTRYSAPCSFTGAIDQVKINVSPKEATSADVTEKAQKAARDIAFEIQWRGINQRNEIFPLYLPFESQHFRAFTAPRTYVLSVVVARFKRDIEILFRPFRRITC